ncbi:MAG TPA: type II toxin-antitoxin system VapC family toxin [Candidatus Methylomirabilis sp.]|nr:type II toxin-antitoxin system VapC family toxin [Candidatus Methylomirabilis sp.]
MTGFVVDASVALKWLSAFRSEPFAPQARGLLDSWQQGAIELIAPDLIWLEVANAHWKAVRQNRCSSEDAQTSLAMMHSQKLPTVPSEPLIDLALDISLQHGRTIYDSLYVALGSALSSDVITADERLVNALPSHFRLKWLGAL